MPSYSPQPGGDPVLVRPAVHSDLSSILRIERESTTAAHWNASAYESLFAEGAVRRVTLVVADGSQKENVYGFVIARLTHDEWEIENLVVTSDRRRLGAGSLLVRELLSAARSSGAPAVLLEVRESNLAARRLYEKIGFTVEGRRRGYYQDPDEDALLLRFVFQ